MSAFSSVARISLSRSSLGGLLGHLPGANSAYSKWALNRRDVGGVFSGCFDSYDEALAAIPQDRLSGWDSDAAASVFEAPLPRQPSVYPVMFWMSQALQAGDRIVDFGGGAAITQRQYTSRTALPPNVSWTVVETAAVARFGTRNVETGSLSDVRFVDSLAAAGGCEVFLSAGALQYMETGLELLESVLAARPRVVILNKLPLSDTADYWTLQNIGPAVCPYRVWRRADFMRSLSTQGYHVDDAWAVSELSCDIPFYPRLCVPEFTGMVLSRDKSECGAGL